MCSVSEHVCSVTEHLYYCWALMLAGERMCSVSEHVCSVPEHLCSVSEHKWRVWRVISDTFVKSVLLLEHWWLIGTVLKILHSIQLHILLTTLSRLLFDYYTLLSPDLSVLLGAKFINDKISEESLCKSSGLNFSWKVSQSVLAIKSMLIIICVGIFSVRLCRGAGLAPSHHSRAHHLQ